MHSQCIFFFLSVFSFAAGASLLEPIIENVVHLQTALPPPETPGFWRKKTIWKARWVKEWKQAKNWRPVWKKVWSPTEIREWVPVPKPPPPDVTASISSSGGGPPGPALYPAGPLIHEGPSGPPKGPFHGPGHQESPSSIYPQGPPNHNGPDPGPDNGPNGGSSGPYPPGPFPPNGPSEPLSSYHPGSSTPLHQVSDEWPHPDAQDLLSSYQTIKNPNDEVEFPKPERPPHQSNRPPPTYDAPRNPPTHQAQFLRPDRFAQQSQPPNAYNAPRNPGILAQFLEPPRSSVGVLPSRLVNEYHYTEPVKNATESSTKPNTVSPYASKLAQAVLREKFNQSLNPTERPSGLTEVVYKPNPSSTTTKPSSAPNRVTKAAVQSTTEGTSNVYIVTPVALG